MKLCNLCTNAFEKLKVLGWESAYMCFDVHCENVYDPFGGAIKETHKECKDDKCNVAPNIRMEEENGINK